MHFFFPRSFLYFLVFFFFNPLSVRVMFGSFGIYSLRVPFGLSYTGAFIRFSSTTLYWDSYRNPLLQKYLYITIVAFAVSFCFAGFRSSLSRLAGCWQNVLRALHCILHASQLHISSASHRHISSNKHIHLAKLFEQSGWEREDRRERQRK